MYVLTMNKVNIRTDEVAWVQQRSRTTYAYQPKMLSANAKGAALTGIFQKTLKIVI